MIKLFFSKSEFKRLIVFCSNIKNAWLSIHTHQTYNQIKAGCHRIHVMKFSWTNKIRTITKLIKEKNGLSNSHYVNTGLPHFKERVWFLRRSNAVFFGLSTIAVSLPVKFVTLPKFIAPTKISISPSLSTSSTPIVFH